MIINTQDTNGNVDTSDAASTNTLVTNEQKIPRYLPMLVSASLLVSTVAFVFSILSCIDDDDIVSDGVVPPILAFIFTLPHHGATLLLIWLQHHQMTSIFPFAPTSTRAIWYSFVLVILWVTSTVICAININYFMVFEPWNIDWSSKGALVTSAMEMSLILTITSVCYLHYRRDKNTHQPAPLPASQVEPKVV